MIRIIAVGLLFSSLICFFEWGNNSEFLIEIEYGLMFGAKNSSLAHPLIIAPAMGQLLLIYSVFKPNRRVVLIGMALLAILILMILLAGILSGKLKMAVSVMPFLIISGIFIGNYRKRKPAF